MVIGLSLYYLLPKDCEFHENRPYADHCHYLLHALQHLAQSRDTINTVIIFILVNEQEYSRFFEFLKSRTVSFHLFFLLNLVGTQYLIDKGVK